MGPIAEISSELMTAEEEYKRNPRINKKDIQELMQFSEDFKISFLFDEPSLIAVFHSCNYDVEATKTCIKAFMYYCCICPEISTNRNIDIPSLQFQSQVIQVNVLPVKDPDGNQIILFRLHPNHLAAREFIFTDTIRLIVMAFRACLMVEGALPGFIIISDLKGGHIGHLFRIGLTHLRKFLLFLQDAIPVRLRGIHVLNASRFTEAVMSLMTPFIKSSELFKLFHFHSVNDMEAAYKHVPKACLPSDYGGDLRSVDFYSERFIEWMRKLKHRFEREDNYLENCIIKNGMVKLFQDY